MNVLFAVHYACSNQGGSTIFQLGGGGGWGGGARCMLDPGFFNWGARYVRPSTVSVVNRVEVEFLEV